MDVRGQGQFQQNASFQSSDCCMRCGSLFHKGGHPECPARNAQCMNCRKIGHWDTICQSPQVQALEAWDKEDLYNPAEESDQPDIF